MHFKYIYYCKYLYFSFFFFHQEYHKGNKNLVIDNVEMNNVVYIYRCQDSNVVIKGKINSVVMDSCRKSAVVVDSVVASIEFVNCQSVQMQVN